MPKFTLTEVVDGEEEEIVHAEVDDFGQVSGAQGGIGMAPAGTEEKLIKQLHN